MTIENGLSADILPSPKSPSCESTASNAIGKNELIGHCAENCG